MATPITYDHLTLIQASTTDTADDTSAAFAWDLSPFYPTNDEHHQTLVVVVDVTVFTPDGGTWQAFVQADTAAAFSSPVEVGRIPIKSTGRFYIPLDLSTVEKLEATATHLKVGVDVTGGTSPSLTWSSYMRKNA